MVQRRARVATALALAALAAATPVDAADAPVVERLDHPENVRPLILVEGDAGFEGDLSGVRGGTGTAEDPYRIAGWTVLAASGFAVRLVDTNAHVILEDIQVHGVEGDTAGQACRLDARRDCTGSIGIDLVRTRNVVVRNVTVLEARDAIRLVEVQNVLVEDADVGRAGDAFSPFNALVVLRSEDVTIRRLDAPDAVNTLNLRNSTRLVVEDSALGGRVDAFVRLVDVDDVTIQRTRFTNVSTLVRDGADHVRLIGNQYDGGEGVLAREFEVSATPHVLVCGNVVRGMSGTLVESLGGVHLVVRGNLFEGGSLAVYSPRVVEAEVSGNVFLDQTERPISLRANTLEARENDFGRSKTVFLRADAGDATTNWWGDASGPSGDGPGSGTPLWTEGNVTFDPWLASAPSRDTSCDATTR